MSPRKLAIIGGGGVRTPLLLYGLLERQTSLDLREVTLYDVERERAELMAALGRELLRQMDGTFALTVTDDLAEAVADAAAIILNEVLLRDLAREIATGRPKEALATYRAYLQRRSASYLRLEGHAESALRAELPAAEDPFTAATGYHRVALEVLTALWGTESRRLVLNARNRGAIADLEPDDVVEVPCVVAYEDVHPLAVGRVPDVVRGLILSVKAYERFVIRAAVERSAKWARLALFVHPLIGEWELAGQLLATFRRQDPEHFGDLAP